MTAEHRQISFAHLDALRGIAALSVGWLHACQLFAAHSSADEYHATLRPDFFFCASAYYIGSIYQLKLESGMLQSEFLLRRLVRLYPMLLVGVLFGTFLLLGHGLLGKSIGAIPFDRSLLIGMCALVLIPVGLVYGYQAFPCNNPIWTMFFEMVFYVVYSNAAGFIRRRMPFLLVSSAIVLGLLSFTFDGISQTGYNSWGSFAAGLGRAAYPFLAGLCIAQYRRSFAFVAKVPATVNILLFILFFSSDWGRGWKTETIGALVIVPMTVFLGARTNLPSCLGTFARGLGAISYPFYMVHQPTLRLFKAFETKVGLIDINSTANVFGGLLVAILAGALIFKLFDVPARMMMARGVHRLYRRTPIPEDRVTAALQGKDATESLGVFGSAPLERVATT